jgi:hypothetical protein
MGTRPHDGLQCMRVYKGFRYFREGQHSYSMSHRKASCNISAAVFQFTYHYNQCRYGASKQGLHIKLVCFPCCRLFIWVSSRNIAQFFVQQTGSPSNMYQSNSNHTCRRSYNWTKILHYMQHTWPSELHIIYHLFALLSKKWLSILPDKTITKTISYVSSDDQIVVIRLNII